MTKIISIGIPHRLVRDQQSYQLVAMIEGAAANAQFINNLQVLSQQRKLLGELQQKLAALPPTASAEERDALKAQADQLEPRVKQNLEFMTKHYGYSIKHNYLLSPVQSALLRKAVDEKGAPIEDEAKATLVAELRTVEAYDELQNLRNRLASVGADPAKKAEADAIRAELFEKYDFDVNAHYILQVRKGALYASVEA